MNDQVEFCLCVCFHFKSLLCFCASYLMPLGSTSSPIPFLPTSAENELTRQ